MTDQQNRAIMLKALSTALRELACASAAARRLGSTSLSDRIHAEWERLAPLRVFAEEITK